MFIWFLLDYDNNYPTHSFLIYKDKNKYYYFEHADGNNRGIYSFNSYLDAVRFQMNKHIECAKKCGNDINNDILKHLHIYEFDEPNDDISFYEYIDMILASNEITDLVEVEKYVNNI